MAISAYLRLKLLDLVFNNTSYGPLASWYASTHTGDPGTTGASESTGGSYARQSGSVGAASSGTVTSDADLVWTNMPASTVTHVGIWDASTTGNFLWGGALTASKTLNSGDTFRINSGQLTCSLT